MKKIQIILSLIITNVVYSQQGILQPMEQYCPQKTIVPLRTWTEIPDDECYYLKDTNNELQDYEGTWKGTWNNKTLFVTFKKITEKYSWIDKYHSDILIARYKTVDANGNILFDNTNLNDADAKIEGIKFIKVDNKYGLMYIDHDLCDTSGSIRINFTDSSKTQLNWEYYQRRDWIDIDCFYYGLPQDQRPEPLPHKIILTKQ